MKKIFLLLPILYGCHFVETGQVSQPRTLPNPNCNAAGIQIISFWDNGIWGRPCTNSLYDNNLHCQQDKDLFLPLKADKLKEIQAQHVDGDTITTGDGKCIADDGTHKYETIYGSVRTIRKVKIIDVQIPNPKYTEATNK